MKTSLSPLVARDLMSQKIHSIAPGESIKAAACIMRDKNIGLLPVVENESLYGVVTDRDIAIRGAAEGLDFALTPVAKVMTVGAVSCDENTPLKGIARLMRDKGLRRIIVTDPLSQPIGVISLDDLAEFATAVAGGTLRSVHEKSQITPPI